MSAVLAGVRQPSRGHPAPETLVSLENLSVEYKNGTSVIRVLEGLNLKIEAGEFISILGPSGCGKSTLLKVISGLMVPLGGVTNFQGKPITGPHKEVGVVFQSPTLLPWKTILQNVMLPGRIMRLDRKWSEERARSLLDLVGLAAFSDAYPQQLSGGMAQRVGIARGLLQDPPLLLMDEPFGALDAMTRERLNLELSSIWSKTGKTIVFITHSISEAVFLSSRVVVMSPRPGNVQEVISIEMPFPRDASVMSSPIFSQYTSRLREFFKASGEL